MSNNYLRRKEAFGILVMFIFGSNVVVGVNSTARQDVWISILLNLFMIVPLVLLYGRLVQLNPNQDFFQMAESALGKVGGKIIAVVYTYYALHLSALVLRNFSDFIEIVSLNQTPQPILMLAIILVVALLARSGAVVLGRWAVIVGAVVVSVVAFTVVFSIPNMKLEFLRPVFGTSLKDVLLAAREIWAFPLAETVLFLSIADSIDPQSNFYRTYTLGLITGIFMLLSIFLRNITTLGPDMAGILHYPSYISARLIALGPFLSRIEGTISVNLLLAGITKIAITITAASKGLCHIFGTRNYKNMLFPVAFAIVALGAFLYESILEMREFTKMYSIYAFPFQFIIPAILWVVMEIRHWVQKNAQKGEGDQAPPQDPQGEPAGEQ